MSGKALNIAVIPGDGIGKEVAPEGVRVLEAAECASISLSISRIMISHPPITTRSTAP